MTNLSELFPQSSGALPAGAITDPKLLPVWHSKSNYLGIYDISSVAYPEAAGFWSVIDDAGAYVDLTTDDTYATICDVTGHGLLFHVVAPSVTATGDTITIRITVDGVATTMTFTGEHSPNDYQRLVLGSVSAHSEHYTRSYYKFYYYAGGDGSGVATGRHHTYAASYLPSIEANMQLNLPKLYFQTSLKVEAKVSDLDTTGFKERAGATFMVLEN